jgi:hypothetical protein
MMDVDRCRDIRPHFVELALGTIDASPSNRIRLHLSEGCPSCAVELEGILEAYYGLPAAMAPRELPDGSGDALRKAAQATPQLPPEPAVVYHEGNERRLLRTLTILAVLAVIAAAWWGWGKVTQIEWAERSQRAAEAQARSVTADYRSLRERLVMSEAVAELVADPTTIVIDLFDNADIARGRALLDWPHRRALLLPPKQPPPPGTTFVLWARSAESVVRIGPMIVDPKVGTHPFALPDLGGPGFVLEVYATPESDVESGAEAPIGNRLLSGAAPTPAPTIE